MYFAANSRQCESYLWKLPFSLKTTSTQDLHQSSLENPTQGLPHHHDLKIFVRQPKIISMRVNTICSSSQPCTYFPPLANMRLEICNHPHTRQICKPCNHPSTFPVTPWLWGIRWGYFLSENLLLHQNVWKVKINYLFILWKDIQQSHSDSGLAKYGDVANAPFSFPHC